MPPIPQAQLWLYGNPALVKSLLFCLVKTSTCAVTFRRNSYAGYNLHKYPYLISDPKHIGTLYIK